MTLKRKWFSRPNLGRFPLFLLLIIALGLNGCGGGGGDDPGAVTPSPQGLTFIEGVAAAGAPIVGTINVRGANGEISLSAIEADGYFSVDVSALSAPFVIWVQGMANGKEVTLYSTIVDPGRVNVTPVTHAVMAMALQEDPVDYFGDNPDADLPSAEAIVEAKAAILGILDTVFQTVGMPANFDLMNGEFTADGTGFDAVLDTVDLQVAAGNVSIIDRFTQTVFAQGPLDGELTQLIDDQEIASTVSNSMAMADLDRIRAVFETIALLYADAQNRPSQATLNAQVRPLMADDFLHNSLGPDEELAAWADPASDEGPSGPFTVEGISIYRQMATRSFGTLNISESGPHQDGVWVVVQTNFGERTDRMLTGFVRDADSPNWLWFGNRIPFDGHCSVNARGIQILHGNGIPQYETGLDFWCEDRGNQAYSRFGIELMTISNEALPQVDLSTGTEAYTFNGLVMTRKDITTEYNITLPADDYFGSHYLVSNGLDLGAITDFEFQYAGFDGSGNPPHIWIELLDGRPIATAELSANPDRYFARITSVAGKALTDTFTSADFSGDTTNVTWELPVNDAIGLHLDYASLAIYNDSDRVSVDVNEEEIGPTQTGYDFPISELADLLAAGSGGNVWICTQDMFHREFATLWSFPLQP